MRSLVSYVRASSAGLAAFDDPFGAGDPPFSASASASAAARGSLPPSVYSFVSAKGLVDPRACERTLEEVLDFLIDYGDVQNASAVLLVRWNAYECEGLTFCCLACCSRFLLVSFFFACGLAFAVVARPPAVLLVRTCAAKCSWRT